MDWLTVLWLAIIVASVIFMLAIERYLRMRRNNRRLRLGSDVPIGYFSDSLSSGSGLNPKFGGGSSGGAGATRSFASSVTESTGVADVRIITANSIVNGELTGDMVSNEISENRLPSADTISNIIEPTAAIDTATNLISTTVDAEKVVTTALEFITDAAGNAIEATGEVAGAVAEVAGEIVSEIISNN